MPIDTSELDSEAPYYTEMKPEWDRAVALLGGTDAMRAAGTLYLPQFPGESEAVYEWRLKVAVLDNFFEAMAEQMAGLMFKEKVTISPEHKSKIPEDHLNNIDKRGTTLHDFAVTVALRLLTKGLMNLHVEHPVNPGARTLADDKRLGLRPYWIDRPVESVYSAHADMKDGNDTLKQVRMRESFVSLAGFSMATSDRRRILQIRDDGNAWFEVWEKQEEKAGPKGEARYTWKMIDEGQIKGGDQPFKALPFITGYARRRGFMLSKPTLSDVAHKNIEHWQSAADQRHILTITRFPTMVQLGTKEPVSHLGPFNLIHSSVTKDLADVKYVEAEGFGIQAGEKDLARIKGEAESMAVRIVSASAPKTDRGEVIDSEREGAPLMRIIGEVERVLNAGLIMHAQYLGFSAEEAGRVKISRELAFTSDDIKAVDALLKLRDAEDVSQETVWQELVTRGFFKSDFDPVKERERLDKELKERSDRAVEMFNARGGGADAEDDDATPPGGPQPPAVPSA